ncbi:glutamate mutase L, partial [Micromonospora sp. URMC 107]|uniref:glutamate mutase L n=1 Tax=Micromonospora sp. URMC 107 TaxID=3423418 RepID=UPI003F19A596
MRYAVCADVGSTYTKVAVVDLDAGALVAAASAPTTVGTDVLHGLDAAVAAATAGLAVGGVPWYVCSSAGGGLRLAVVGYERLVTAQAGRRVGLSAGANVVHVAAGRLGAAELTALRAARPDVVLLVGGTDGGDAETLTHNATRLARARWRVPVVLAGNVDVRDGLHAVLAGAGVPVTVAENVLPRIGVLAPASARAAIREVFLRHVIGGKRLSRGSRFARLVRAATPDAVLTGVEVLADALGGDLVVVDVGGATTDVYSVLTPDERATGPGREVAGSLWRARTVEGDLGMRWSAPGVVRAAVEERLLSDAEGDDLAAGAAVRAGDPGFLPSRDADRAVDARIAALAATVALRRHARG